MSIMQRMTLIGLYNYKQTFNQDLFSGLELPEGYDKQTFIDSLLLEHGEKPVLYSNPDFMQNAISAWGRKWFLELSRIYEALTAEYNPIYNYDRYEDYEDHEGKKLTSQTNAGRKATDKPKYDDDVTNDFDVVTEQNVNGTTTTEQLTDGTSTTEQLTDGTSTTEQLTDGTSTIEQLTSGEVEHQVSADNSGTYQPESKDITNGGKSETTTNAGKTETTTNAGKTETTTNAGKTETTTNAGKTESTFDAGKVTVANDGTIKRHIEGTTQDLAETSNSKTEDAETRNFHHTAHLYGNIGVTTSAQMVTEIVEQRIKYNLYETACRLFANDLLIGIY